MEITPAPRPRSGRLSGRRLPPPDQGFAQQPPPASAPMPVAGIQIPSGTPITVRMIDAVDSKVAHLGQTFRASIDEPVMINGQTVIPRGADALAKLVEDQQSGKFEGKTILTLALTDITINGQMIDTTTGDVSKASSSRGARTAKVVGEPRRWAPLLVRWRAAGEERPSGQHREPRSAVAPKCSPRASR